MDPFVQSPDSIDPSQSIDQSSPDTGITYPDFQNGVPLSGDTYSPSHSVQGGNTNLPFVPTATPQIKGLPNGWGTSPPQNQAPADYPQLKGLPQGWSSAPPSSRLPSQIGTAPPPNAAPIPNYGNDTAGSVLQAEQQLPDWARAGVHGAQSQIIPGATGLVGGIAAGALVGSVVPVVGTVIGGIIGGLAGYAIGSAAQDELTKNLVPQQTRDAYEIQAQYERNNFPIQYGLGELFPQILAFKPNPKAIMGAFRLAGSVSAAPLAEKWAILKGPDIADRLAYQDHQDALNQIMMMAYGTGYTAIQAKQQIDSGNVQPLLLAVNLLGSSLLSKPRWIKDVAPENRAMVDDSATKATQSFADGAEQTNPEYQKAWQEHNDAIQLGDQAKIAETQARMDAATQARKVPGEEQAAQSEATTEVAPRTPDAVGQELINEVDSANTPQEKLRIAQEVDAIAARNRLPNWESQVARVQSEGQGQLQAQTQTLRNLAENSSFTRPQAPSEFDPRAFANAVAKQEEPQSLTDEQMRERTQKAIASLRNSGEMPTGERLPHTQDVLRDLRNGNQEPVMAEDKAMSTTALRQHINNEHVYSNRTIDSYGGGAGSNKDRAVLDDFHNYLHQEDQTHSHDELNIPAIKNLLSEAKRTINGETRATTELDPSLIPTLGKNMYSGDIGRVAVKEGIQNAMDSLRGVTDQAKSIHLAIGKEGFTISDSGKGMLPEVATKELVDIGGSTKEVGESGGWGLAKVALFSNAQDIQIRTTAKRPNGTLVETSLSGSGQDWADKNKGLRVRTIELGPNPPVGTGTTMTIRWNPDVQTDTYEAYQHVRQTIENLNVPENVRISVSGDQGNLNSDSYGLLKDRFTHLANLKQIGANVDVYASPQYAKNEYGNMFVTVLNNGIYQFRMGVDTARGIDMPSKLVVDIHATGSPKADNYPWETNRQSLRPELQEQIKKYIKETLVNDAAKKMQDQIRAALVKAPRLAGSRFKVVDLSGKMDPEVVNAIADSPPLHGFVQQASRALGAFKGGTDVGPEFFGISLSNDHLGVNIHASAGGPTRTRNMILINPFTALDEVTRGLGFNLNTPDTAPVAEFTRNPSSISGQARLSDLQNEHNWNGDLYIGPTEGVHNGPYRIDYSSTQWGELAKALAARTAATLIHEYSHETSRGHEEPFSGALTRDLATHLDAIYSYAKRMTRYLTENNYDGIKEIERLNREHNLSSRMGGNEVFRNVSTGAATEGQQPGLHQGNTEASTEGGARPVQPVRAGGVREAGQLAPSTSMGRSEPGQQVIGERNGIQQEAAGVPTEAGPSSQTGETGITPQGVNPGEIGSEANPTGIPANGPEAVNPLISSEGGNGNAEAGAHGTPTARAGIVRPDAGNESGTGITDASGTNAGTGANEATDAATTGTANAEATNNPTGNSTATERNTTYGEQPEARNARAESVNRGANTTAANPTIIKATADSIRAIHKIPGYVPTPEEKGLLTALDNKLADLKQTANPKPWPVADTRLPNAVDKSLLNRTNRAVEQTKLIEGEGGRAYADRLVKATGLYKNVDHALEIARGARDGFVEVVPLGDKVGFKIDGKVYKDTPSFHVANWDQNFRGVVHSILDNIPNEYLSTEPKDQSPVQIDIQQLRDSFADQYQPHTDQPSILLSEEKVEPPQMQPHDFAMSSHSAGTPTSKLSSSSAVNKVKAGIAQVQEHLDVSEELANNNPFNPEIGKKAFEELDQAAGGGSGIPPRTPLGGGEEPPTPGDRRAVIVESQQAHTEKLQDNYTDALKQGLLIDHPVQKRIHAGLNDILSSAMRTFDINLWQKHPRVWIKEASDAAKAFATYYQKIGGDIKLRINDLEAQSPGAADRIRQVFTAGDDQRPSLLEQMAPEEAALANHLHTYWQLLGDILTRSGVIKSALEDYFPLIADKTTPPRTANNLRLAAKSTHSIARLIDKEDGSLLFKTPEELQQWADEKGLGWKIKTDVGDVFAAQGSSVIKALVMKHTVDQMMHNEFELNKFGESAPAIMTQKNFEEHMVALDNSDLYTRGSKVIGPWQGALTRPKWIGNQRVPEDLFIRKDLAEQMSREASFKEMGDNPAMKLARFLTTVNNYFKVFKFALTPMHAYSMLGNVSAHTGLSGTYGVVRRGANITNNPAMRYRFFQLMKASGSTEPIGEGIGGPHSVLNNMPGVGPFFKLQEKLMWKTIGYNSLYGLGDKLSQEFMAKMAVEHPEQPITQFDADKFGMDAAKKAIGYLDQLDMSKNYNLGANILLLANRWTTGQLRTMGEAFGLKRLANIGNPVPLEGSSLRATQFMQRRQIEMSRRLITGGMLRLFMVGTALSTIGSSIFNNGVPSTPWDNFQKDPAHTFDIYQGRDPVTNRDMWVHMPFYLFQREMLDWGMAAVKAQEQGKEFIDKDNWGDSILAAPFVRFANKMNPVTKTSLEVATGQEIGQWMKGYDKAGIDADKYIVNLNQSLQKMGIPDQGSIENRLLYAMKSLLPGVNYPQNLPNATSDPWAVASAIAGLPVGGNETNVELGFLGSRIDQGQAFTMGPDGQMIPTWQATQQRDQKAQLGQQILEIASTLGTGSAADETQKFEQMEGLRQQAGFSPGQLVQLLLYGAGHNTGGQGLLYQNLPPKTAADVQPQVMTLNGKKLTPEQQVTYEGIKFQKEAFAMSQAMSDPNWKNTNFTDRSAIVNAAKTFADRITDQQFNIGLGTAKGNVVTTQQGIQMMVTYNNLAKYTQLQLKNTATFSSASVEDQQAMMNDRTSATETAVWDRYFGTGILKNASEAQMLNYVQVHSGLRDEVRQLINELPSYKQSQNPISQAAMLASGLAFADNLANQAAEGKTLKTFNSPLNQQQLALAVKNGIILQDAAVKELHNSFIYQEASATDQGLLDQKYTNLAHNIALYDMRQGVNSQPGSSQGFDATLRTALAADEGYQTLVEQYFGVGGLQVLKTKLAELNDLKTRFRQEYAVAPGDLTRYNTMINRWYDQQNPDYAEFKRARTWWERNDPVGQAYRATAQSNIGFESLDPLALSE